MSLLFLNTDDFSIKQGKNGKIMCTRLTGFSFLLFYSNGCKHCKSLIPIFKELPKQIHGCQFGMVNVTSHESRGCIELSRQTICQIDYVPLLIIYIHGRPFMTYKGAANTQEIQEFIIKVADSVRQNNNNNLFLDNTHSNTSSSSTSTSSSTPNNKLKNSKQHPFTCGIPYCDDETCYLIFDEAYPEIIKH